VAQFQSFQSMVSGHTATRSVVKQNVMAGCMWWSKAVYLMVAESKGQRAGVHVPFKAN
jgi:hypothetical protein